MEYFNKMKKLLNTTALLILTILGLVSCSNDDEQVCMVTNITMTINGETQSFQAYGRGISLRQNGYELELNLSRRVGTFSEQDVLLVLPYKKTGNNVIEHFFYSHNINNTTFEGDFMDGEFQSKVLTNTSNCFYATFSGKLNDNNQEIIITDGILSYEYEESFDE
jgi:hypothetical protein